MFGTTGNMDDNADLKRPLREVIMGDFGETLKRIKKVVFLPDKILICLISDNVSVRFSVLHLTMRVFMATCFSGPIELSREWLEKFVTYDKNLQSLVIPISGIRKMILSRGKECQLYPPLE